MRKRSFLTLYKTNLICPVLIQSDWTNTTTPPRNCMVGFVWPYHYQVSINKNTSLNHCTNRFASEYAHVLLSHIPFFFSFYSLTEPLFGFFLSLRFLFIFLSQCFFLCLLTHCKWWYARIQLFITTSLVKLCIFIIEVEL